MPAHTGWVRRAGTWVGPRTRARRYAPVDEDHYPAPTSTYALSKVASETLAEQIAGWSGRPFIALRFSNIFTPEDYAILPETWADPNRRKWNLWGYIDVRDAAQSCRLALTAPVTGAGFEPQHSWRDHLES